jgi:hypothetical protein
MIKEGRITAAKKSQDLRANAMAMAIKTRARMPANSSAGMSGNGE